MNSSFASLVLIATTTFVFSMQAYDREPLSNIPVVENVSFETHIQPITSSVCISCHSQGSKDWSSYLNAYRNRYQIYQSVVINRTMPESKFLSDKDRALFRDWYNQGSPR